MFNRIVAIICMMLSLGQFSFDAGIDEINLGGNLFLVNRTYKLDMRYVPEDLIMPNILSTSEQVLMRKEAALALEKLFAAAQMEQGFVLHAISGYRSYHTQKTIYNRKIDRVGSAKRAQKYVAPPGASEHQLGLAMDIGTPNRAGLNEGFGETKEGIWVNENAHRFGFIIRYKRGWEEITGYNYEPWHIRYVGVEHAQKIYEQDIPLEEYIEQIYASKEHKLKYTVEDISE